MVAVALFLVGVVSPTWCSRSFLIDRVDRELTTAAAPQVAGGAGRGRGPDGRRRAEPALRALGMSAAHHRRRPTARAAIVVTIRESERPPTLPATSRRASRRSTSAAAPGVPPRAVRRVARGRRASPADPVGGCPGGASRSTDVNDTLQRLLMIEPPWVP